MRKRIVINLDAAAAGAGQPANGGKRRRWPRVLALFALFVLLLVVVGAIAGFAWWRYYQTKPAYTLALLIDAAQRNDLAELQKRIDDEEIAKNMLATVRQKAVDRYGFALSGPIQERIDVVIPSLLPRIQQITHDEVVKKIDDLAAATEKKPFILLVVAVPSLMTITTEGVLAKVKAPLGDRTLELTMKRDADRWKVTEFKDDVVIQRVVDSVMKELPAIGSVDSNNPLLKKSPRGKRPRRRK